MIRLRYARLKIQCTGSVICKKQVFLKKIIRRKTTSIECFEGKWIFWMKIKCSPS